MLKPRLTYSNVTATLALLLAIGGSAYASSGTSTTSMARSAATTGTVQLISRTVDVATGNPDPVTVLKSKGLGVLFVEGTSCTQIPGMVTATLMWKNQTTTSQRISYVREGSTVTSDVAAGATGTVNQMTRFANADIFQGEFRVSGYVGKHAVMDVSVAIGGDAGPHCRVAVVATVST